MKLHLGCGKKSIKGFINIDIQESESVDMIADIMDLPYEKNSISLIYGCSMLEHFGKNNKLSFFRNTSWTDVIEYWYTILKPGGELYISVPDFEAICKEYLEKKDISSLIGIALGGQKNKEDLHGMLFDFKNLSEGLKNAGFKNIEKYNWWEFEPFLQDGYDDFSAAYLPHMDFENGRLMMLNVKAIK
jgi:predicted SAM-dependent methyltransferase